MRTMKTSTLETIEGKALSPEENPCTQKDVRHAIRETLLRIHFLIHALEKTGTREHSVAAKDRGPLITDLVEESTALEDLLGQPFSPTLASITSPSAKAWQKDLTKSLSCDSDRWESTLHIIYEIAEIQNLIYLPEICKPEQKESFSQLHRKLAAHKLFHENILAQWVNTELSHGRPVDRVIEADAQRHRKQWHEVVNEVLGKRSIANSLANVFAPHSLQTLWNRFTSSLHWFSGDNQPYRKAA